MAIDETGLTKGLVRKLNALRKSVGDELAEEVTVRPSRRTVRPAVRLAREAKLCIKGETDVGAAGFALLAWEDPTGADGALSPICAWGHRSTACWWRCWPPRGCRSGG